LPVCFKNQGKTEIEHIYLPQRAFHFCGSEIFIQLDCGLRFKKGEELCLESSSAGGPHIITVVNARNVCKALKLEPKDQTTVKLGLHLKLFAILGKVFLNRSLGATVTVCA